MPVQLPYSKRLAVYWGANEMRKSYQYEPNQSQRKDWWMRYCFFMLVVLLQMMVAELKVWFDYRSTNTIRWVRGRKRDAKRTKMAQILLVLFYYIKLTAAHTATNAVYDKLLWCVARWLDWGDKAKKIISFALFWDTRTKQSVTDDGDFTITPNFWKEEGIIAWAACSFNVLLKTMVNLPFLS